MRTEIKHMLLYSGKEMKTRVISPAEIEPGEWYLIRSGKEYMFDRAKLTIYGWILEGRKIWMPNVDEVWHVYFE
jgi:hypothetical protein